MMWIWWQNLKEASDKCSATLVTMHSRHCATVFDVGTAGVICNTLEHTFQITSQHSKQPHYKLQSAAADFDPVPPPTGQLHQTTVLTDSWHWTLCENMTSSTKPQYVVYCLQSRTEPQPHVTGSLVLCGQGSSLLLTPALRSLCQSNCGRPINFVFTHPGWVEPRPLSVSRSTAHGGRVRWHSATWAGHSHR